MPILHRLIVLPTNQESGSGSYRSEMRTSEKIGHMLLILLEQQRNWA